MNDEWLIVNGIAVRGMRKGCWWVSTPLLYCSLLFVLNSYYKRQKESSTVFSKAKGEKSQPLLKLFFAFAINLIKKGKKKEARVFNRNKIASLRLCVKRNGFLIFFLPSPS
ncbi:MAG: hypothetical protein IPL28_19185 [Chloroflexi bacterium]|nr:hypothetical protein [Chloroflexota bacterium]